MGIKSPKGPPANAATLQTARRMLMYMLIALGSCTVITALLLVLQTMDSKTETIIWVDGRQSGATAGNKGAPAAAAGPLPKELDPDYVEAPAKQIVLKKCPAGCETVGNCNAEEGRCECPFGYTGAACQTALFPACRMTANSTEMHCGEAMPRSCECLRQCRDFFCPHKGRCETPRDPWFVRCFERFKAVPGKNGSRASNIVAVGRDAAGIISDVPEEWEEKQQLIKWYRGIRHDLQREIITRAQATYVRPLAAGGAAIFALPASLCPNKCGGRGQCIKTSTVGPKCLCWQGYTGTSCEQVVQGACINRCMNRGTCKGGFCHCKPGYWGKDCSRSKAYAPHNAHSSVTALKVYAYDLPTHLAFDMERFVGFQGHDPTYIAYKGFMSGFLHDSTVRTENPWEANLFYVPALTYAYSSNMGDVVEHLHRVMSWVRDTHPFFNRTGGKDHFFWLPNDRGACWIDPADPLLGGPLKVVHFGFHQESSKLPGDFKLMPQKGAACFMPERDIVAAPYFNQQEVVANETYAKFDVNEIPRGKLLFFAGSIKEKEYEYSGGVRQELWKLFKANKFGDQVFVSPENNLKNYKELVRSSKFCLAPWGHGWGNRLSQYMVMGCVPVIVQDGVYQPYQDILPYHEFSIRIPVSRLPHIAEVLSSISDQEYRALRAGVAKYWPAFVWHPSWGGQAYNYTIQSLRQRANNLLAGVY